MRKLIIDNAEVVQALVRQEIVRSDESKYDHRLHGLLLVSTGRDCYEVARLLGRSPHTVESWVRSFQNRGFEGLREGAHPGRPSSITEVVREAINRDLRRNPRELGYPQGLWDGKLLSHHLQQAYDVHLAVRQCQRLFHALGFRQRKPRPVIAKSDPEAQRAYKKTHRSGK